MAKVLRMSFQNAQGRTVSVSLREPVDPLDPVDVSSCIRPSRSSTRRAWALRSQASPASVRMWRCGSVSLWVLTTSIHHWRVFSCKCFGAWGIFGSLLSCAGGGFGGCGLLLPPLWLQLGCAVQQQQEEIAQQTVTGGQQFPQAFLF